MTVHASRSSGKPRSESTAVHRRKIKLNQTSRVSGCSPDQMAIVIASRVTVLQLHILSRKFPPFLGFLSVAAARKTKRSEVCISSHFVGFLCRQFVDRAERLRHKNGKMICCPFARILCGRGGCGAKNHPRVKCGGVLRRFSLRQETVRPCGGLNGRERPALFLRRDEKHGRCDGAGPNSISNH